VSVVIEKYLEVTLRYKKPLSSRTKGAFPPWYHPASAANEPPSVAAL